MDVKEDEKSMEEVRTFLEKHFLETHGLEDAYLYSVCLYYAYLVDCMKEAEKIRDGEVFDEYMDCAVVKELKEAGDILCFLKKELHHEHGLLDVAEKITFQGCRLEAGCLIGDVESAVTAARRWIADYSKDSDNPFLFETGIYILTLLEEEYDLGRMKEEKQKGTGGK